MKKKLLLSAILLAIATLLPTKSQAYDFSAVAPSGQTLFYNIVNGNAIVTSENPSFPYYTVLLSGDLTIPSSVTHNGFTYNVTAIESWAFAVCYELTSVTIPNSVTSIGAGAFYQCYDLASITIPNTVTSIGNYAFYECTSLASVTIPNSVTFISNCTFYYCTSLTSVTIPNSVTSIGAGAFYQCYDLASITIPNSVTSIGAGAFYQCYDLASITIPNSVTSIGDSAFYECTSLASVTIPTSITSIGNGTFQGCSNLTSVTIPNTVTSIGNYAFYECTSLATFTIPTSVTYIGDYAFYECSSLVSVTIPNYVTYIGNYAFYECSNLVSVTIGNSVTFIGNSAFYNCWNLTSVIIPNSVTTIGNSAFEGCYGLTYLTIGNSVTTIGDDAFRYCSYSLNSITVASGNTVYDSRNNCNAIIETSTNTLLYGCNNTTIPNSVTSIGAYAFYFCRSLNSVTIPNPVTAIGDYAFGSSTGLTTVNFNATNCTSMGDYVFEGCSSLTTLNIGDNVQTIPNYAFYGCGPTTVTIGNSVSSIGNNAFASCDGLTSVYYTGDVSGWCGISFNNNYSNPLYYGHNLYINNSLLTDLVLPNTVDTIHNYAFINCSTLTSITIPNSVTSIGNSAFYNCSGITEIHSLAHVAPTLGNNAFYNVSSSIPVYIPCGASGSYYGRWSSFSNLVEDEAFSFSAISADNNMGAVQILTAPTCTNPQAQVYASANNGYRFDHWSDNSTSNPYTLTLTEDTELIAYFVSDGGGELPSGNAPSIACVGVDMNGHNVVRWEPRQGVSVVRYNIYREGLGGYSIVGYVLSTGATEYSWVDDNSNTATQAYSYKISEVAANGTESDLSLPHTTMHLQISQGQGSTWNLSWTPYVGFNYSGYRIFRGTTATSMSLLTELSSSATTFSDNNAPSGNVYYQIEVVATGAKSITASSRSNIATSVQNQQFTITVLSDNSSMGTVSGGGTFAEGTTTTISATPLSGYTFSQWSDGSTQAQRTITVTGNATYTAYFTAGGSETQQYLITVNTIDPAMGTVYGGGLFDAGTTTTIMATPNYGFQFVQWQDGNTERIRTITVTSDATYTAFFDRSNGIDDLESADDVKIYTRGNTIVIDYSGQQAADSRQNVVVYDVMGRVIKQAAGSGQQTAVEIPVTSAGVYMVKIGNKPSRKVVVRP